jgi:hypothetical protein
VRARAVEQSANRDSNVFRVEIVGDSVRCEREVIECGWRRLPILSCFSSETLNANTEVGKRVAASVYERNRGARMRRVHINGEERERERRTEISLVLARIEEEIEI